MNRSHREGVFGNLTRLRVLFSDSAISRNAHDTLFILIPLSPYSMMDFTARAFSTPVSLASRPWNL